MARKKRKPKVGVIILIALFVSILLYVAGLYSGLSVSKMIKQDTKQEVSFLVDYVNRLDSNLQSIQLQELFISSLEDADSCKFEKMFFSEVDDNLKYYWSVLPERLEEYETNRKLSEEYLQLKKEYTLLSLRAWIAAKKNYKKCNTTTIPILYFYSTNCEKCVLQGETLDQLKEFLSNRENSSSFTVFTIDFNQNERTIDIIKQLYQINSTPALIIKDNVLQGDVASANEILLAMDINLLNTRIVTE